MTVKDILGVVASSIGFVGTLISAVSLFVEIDGRKKVVLSLKKAIYLLFFVTMLCIGAGIIIELLVSDIKSNPSISITSDSPVDEKVSPFSVNGFLFPHSSTQRITVADLARLKKNGCESGYTYEDLLCFSINEIYARHGYQFSESKYNNFYNQYQWYRDIDKVPTITWEMFNIYEQSNITLLTQEQRDNGFR